MDTMLRRGSTVAENITGSNGSWRNIITPEATNVGVNVATYFTRHLTSLVCYADIKSLEAVAAPDIPIDATPSERLQIIQEHEWVNNPYYLLQIGIRPGGQTFPVFEASLMNQLGAPYYTINLMTGLGTAGDYIIGEQAALMARILDVGHGYPKSGDNVTIHGCTIDEAWQLPQTINIVSNNDSWELELSAGDTYQISPRQNRKGLIISTKTDNSLIEVVESNSFGMPGHYLMGTGSVYEINSTRLWTGRVHLRAINDSVLVYQEDW